MSSGRNDQNGLERFEVGPLPTNTYLIGETYIVDPAGPDEALFQTLDDRVETLEAILLTHCHWDHIAGIESILERYPECRILCHSDEFDMLGDPNKNFSSMQGDGISYEADAPIESCALAINDSSLEILETPGHSPGGVSLYWPDRSLVLSGDALFKQGVGRTDLPGSDRETLQDSLENVLMKLPDETTVYPGHGPETTIEVERRTNPFL